MEERDELLTPSDSKINGHNSSKSHLFLPLFCCTNMKCSYPPEKVSAVRSHKRAEKYFSGRGNVFWLDSLDHRREDLKFFREKGLPKGR